MKKRLLSLLLIVCLFMLCACQNTPAATHPTQATNITQVTEPSVTDPPATEPPVTEPPHSDLYIPGVSVDDVILYFNEICLDAEFANNGNPSYIQKWVTPLLYTVNGNYTTEDIAVLESFVSWLNTIEGFPGMQVTTSSIRANLSIYFCDQQELLDRMGSNFYSVDGAVTFWYNNNEIYEEIICYRTDLSQYLRNSVILEEIYNGLGPIQDTTLREDSIIYSGFSQPQALTAVDELILKLLYHPDIHSGMDAQQCEAVIRKLYY